MSEHSGYSFVTTCFQEVFMSVLTLSTSASRMFSAFHYRSWYKTRCGGAQHDDYCMHTLFPETYPVCTFIKNLLSAAALLTSN